MNIVRIVALAVVAALATSVITVKLMCVNTKKIVVVDAIKLFNGFRMKQEMEQEVAVVLKSMNARCDSLATVLKAMESSGKDLDRSVLDAYREARTGVDQQYESSNAEINQQVWKRLNIMLADFGKQRNYGVVVGANGMGSVLYNSETYDVTEEAIKFVNNAYEVKK